MFIANSLRRPLNEHYVHETRVLFLYFFRISKQTSINSFSKATKCFLVIFGAKWSWGLACLVSVSCLLLLFSRKKRKLQKKFRTLFYLACFSASMNFSLCRPAQLWLVYGQNRHHNSRNNGYYTIHHSRCTKHNLKTLYTKYEVIRGIISMSPLYN